MQSISGPHLIEKICAHNPSASKDNKAKLSNSMVSPSPPVSGEYVLKKSAADLGEQHSPVTWFKFIYPSSKPRMTETSIGTPVHVAYSPLASMNRQWTITLHDGYPCFHAQGKWNIWHPLFPLSATFCLPCFTLVLISFTPPMMPNMIFPV